MTSSSAEKRRISPGSESSTPGPVAWTVLMTGGEFVLNRTTFETAALRELGIHVIWFLSDRRKLSRRDLYPLDIVEPRSGLAVVPQVLRLLRRRGVQVVLCHVGARPRRTLLVACLARLMARPVVIELVGSETRTYRDRGWKSRLFMRTLLRLANHIVYLHADLRDALRELDFVPLERTTQIPVGTRIPPTHTEDQTGLVLYANRLIEHKRPTLLVEAASHVLAEVPEARFRFVGSGFGYPEEQRVLDRIQELGLSERVEVLPFTREIEPHFRDAALFVYPTQIGHINNALLEAMAHRLPVVTSSVPGMEASVEDGVTGIRVCGEDPRVWADAIVSLLRDRARRREMGQRGRAKVQREFSVERAMRTKAELFRRLAGES